MTSHYEGYYSFLWYDFMIFLPCLDLRPLKGFLSWHGALQGLSTSRLVRCFRKNIKQGHHQVSLVSLGGPVESGKDNGLRQLLQIFTVAFWHDFSGRYWRPQKVPCQNNTLFKNLWDLLWTSFWIPWLYSGLISTLCLFFLIHEQASILAHITRVDFLQSYPLITPITNLCLFEEEYQMQVM